MTAILSCFLAGRSTRLSALGVFCAWAAFAASGRSQNFTPEQSAARLKAPNGLKSVMVGAEPEVRQPLSMSFDARGRLWVLQYLQYPNPAGLKAVSRDQFLRTVWDKKLEPPPRGPAGADKIVILEDPGSDGRFRKSKEVITGLNLATGFALGRGGIFVVQAPYLLFYPDKDQDDRIDGPPEVLLDGFGMEDSHAHANSLVWGPDGWLYGAQGSTVTAHIRGITFQQGIWRYHPDTKKFELFAEGGGNTWGLDFSPEGEVLAGTNWGGFALLHQMQGAYYIKGFAKHGPLQNPHAYGYFDHVPYKNFVGGHVTCGGVLHQGKALGSAFDRTYIAGNLLSNVVNWHKLDPAASSYTASHGGVFLNPRDAWFRPVDLLDGPDGAIYIADWHDHRATHLDPIDNWDRRNGRIIKVQAEHAAPLSPFDLKGKTSGDLVALLEHPEVWWQREALRLLYERKDASLASGLMAAIKDPQTPHPVRLLWALNATGEAKEPELVSLLAHPDFAVRMWAVRLLGDPGTVHSESIKPLLEAIRKETNPRVVAQMACSAKRLPTSEALPLIKALCLNPVAPADPQIPLLVWWALETHAVSGQKTIASWVADNAWIKSPLVAGHLLERLTRRYTAKDANPKNEGYKIVASLLRKAPAPATAGLEKALDGQFLAKFPEPLKNWLDRKRSDDTTSVQWITLGTRLGDEDSWYQALARVSGPKTEEGDRLKLIKLVAQSGKPEAPGALIEILENSTKPPVLSATLDGLAGFADPAVAEAVLKRFAKWPKGVQTAAINLLVARPGTAASLLDLLDTGKIAQDAISLDQARRLSVHKDAELAKRVEKRWGKLAPATEGEKQARISYIQLIIGRSNESSPDKGKGIFEQKCATCHQLFGKGQKVGPDLTSADRQMLAPLVGHIVDPSGHVRPEFRAWVLETKDGRILTGLVAEETAGAVTLLDAKGEKQVIGRDRIDTFKPSEQSLMPEKLLDGLSDAEIVDFFAYLRLKEPPK